MITIKVSLDLLDSMIDSAWESDSMQTVFDSLDSTCITFIDGSMLQYWAEKYKVMLHPADIRYEPVLVVLE